MEDQGKGKFIKAYLKHKKLEAGLLLLFCAVFAVTFALYHLPLAAVAYPTLLCLLAGSAALIFSAFRAYETHRELVRLSSLSAELIRDLPPPSSALEEDYARLTELLCAGHRQLASSLDRRYRDMIDYYTMWAHQIKTPIASMRLQIQQEDSEFARRMSAELSRIEQYVEMVLAFLRLDADSSDYVIRECDVDEIIRQALKKFSGDFISRKLTLSYEPLMLKVVTDEKWLSFVIEQLLSNALKYTASGGITISLEQQATLCIRDTGIGIAAEDLPRVFEKGYTGYNGRSDKRASGIGLYLCRRICNNLGHAISIESEAGCGTVVKLDLAQKSLQFC